MSLTIDLRRWQIALARPNWYDYVAADFRRLEIAIDIAKKEGNEAERQKLRAKKDEIYTLIEKAIANDSLPLGLPARNLDRERQPIDTIIIHHTGSPAGMSLARLNAIQLMRLYGLYFHNPTDKREQDLKGEPVWSGHFYKGRQVFWAYHWLVREDGTSEQILLDEYIGWHAGDWAINTRSVSICVDDDLSEKTPSTKALDSITNIIRTHYPSVSDGRILGHADVNSATECPGKLFHDIWRQKLLAINN